MTRRSSRRLRAGIALLQIIPILYGCHSGPALPTDPEYGTTAANSTADLAAAGGLEERIAAIADLLDQKVREIAAARNRDEELSTTLERSYARLVRQGLLLSLENSHGDGEEVVEPARRALGRLQAQRGPLESSGAVEALEACRDAISRLKDLISGKSGLFLKNPAPFPENKADNPRVWTVVRLVFFSNGIEVKSVNEFKRNS